MILDTLANGHLYHGLGQKFVKAFEFLSKNDLAALEKGKYEIDGETIFAIVNEYETVDPATQQMESHRKFIDLQYMVSGTELVGHDFLQQQTPSQAYDTENDYMLFGEKPAFFSRFPQGHFAIFFPTDLHMPNIQAGGPGQVKKIVIKISVE